jgi:hypothetical protein
MLKKVGVSPLIAGIFLIIIASALGFLLASQINVNEQIESVKLRKEGICGDNILIELNNNVCVDNNWIIFNIENKGDRINNLQVRTITDEWVFEEELNKEIKSGKNSEFSYNYNSEKYGEVKQLKIRPIIENEEEIIICLDKAITVPAEEILTC